MYIYIYTHVYMKRGWWRGAWDGGWLGGREVVGTIFNRKGAGLGEEGGEIGGGRSHDARQYTEHRNNAQYRQCITLKNKGVSRQTPGGILAT